MISNLPAGAVTDQVRAAMQSAQVDIGDSSHTAEGWRVVGDDVYTCVPPPGYEIDQWILRRIHAFDRSVIPIWRMQAYLPPGSNQAAVFVHHGLAHYVKHPRRHLTLFGVNMPQPQRHQAPNELILIWEAFDERMMREGGPGGFMRFGPELLRYLEKDYVRDTARPVAEMMEAKERLARERKAADKMKRAAEAEYRHRALNQHVSRVQETATEDDFHAYQARVQELARRRRK